MPDATRQKLFLYDLWFLYGWGFLGGFWLVVPRARIQNCRAWGDRDNGRPCRMLCPSLDPSKGHPQTLSPPLHEAWTQPAQTLRVQSQALGTACPSAPTLGARAQEKSQAHQCQKHGLGAHFSFPRAGEGMRG